MLNFKFYGCGMLEAKADNITYYICHDSNRIKGSCFRVEGFLKEPFYVGEFNSIYESLDAANSHYKGFLNGSNQVGN